jgi:hypothetical protein
MSIYHGSDFTGGVDSARARRVPTPGGYEFSTRDYGRGKCDFTMADGVACGREFARVTFNQQRCDRHNSNGRRFKTAAELRVRRSGE